MRLALLVRMDLPMMLSQSIVHSWSMGRQNLRSMHLGLFVRRRKVFPHKIDGGRLCGCVNDNHHLSMFSKPHTAGALGTASMSGTGKFRTEINLVKRIGRSLSPASSNFCFSRHVQFQPEQNTLPYIPPTIPSQRELTQHHHQRFVPSAKSP